jgi:UDP-2,4-diacetamido-2,4,6-trideoxy-beta-L-altropyranose hydrolase
MKKMMPLIIRADANGRIGTGHIMRCIAFGKAWQNRSGHVTFVSCCESNNLKRRIADEGFNFVPIKASWPDPSDLTIVLEKLSEIKNQASSNVWIVIDGYHFDTDYQSHIKQAGYRLLAVDDNAHLDYYYADIVLNQNINAEHLQYHFESNTRLLLGLRHVLLRPEFLNRAPSKIKIPQVSQRLLVTMGGADKHNQTQKVIRALENAHIDGLEVVVVIGSANPHLQQIQSESRLADLPVRVVSNAQNMAELMSWADLAVSAGGTTCWELAFMGLPALVIILADNQKAVAQGLDKAGAAVNLGWYHTLSSLQIAEALRDLAVAMDKRTEMIRRGRNLIDGKGIERILAAMGQDAEFEAGV